jgi:hypothetical protein
MELGTSDATSLPFGRNRTIMLLEPKGSHANA